MIANTYLYKTKLQATEKTIDHYAEILRNDPDLQKLIDEHNASKAHYDYMVKCSKKKVIAHLVNRLGVALKDAGYNYVSTWPTMDSAMDEAYGLTNERNLSANIVDRETGEILVMYEGGQITWRDKSTLPDGEVIPVYELDYDHPYVKVSNYVVFDLVDNKYYEPQTGSI